jgi:hypothetical protein
LISVSMRREVLNPTSMEAQGREDGEDPNEVVFKDLKD